MVIRNRGEQWLHDRGTKIAEVNAPAPLERGAGIEAADVCVAPARTSWRTYEGAPTIRNRNLVILTEIRRARHASSEGSDIGIPSGRGSPLRRRIHRVNGGEGAAANPRIFVRGSPLPHGLLSEFLVPEKGGRPYSLFSVRRQGFPA